MQFRFKAQDTLRNVSYLVVSDKCINYSSHSGIPFAICNFARDEVALEFRLRDLHGSTKSDADKAASMLAVISAETKTALTWEIDATTMTTLRANAIKPTHLPASTMLEISTDHVPQCTLDALASDAKQCPDFWNAVSWLPFGEGWMVYVSNDQSGALRRCGHPGLADLIDFADRHCFSWVRLDPEFRVVPQLPTFPHAEHIQA